MEQFRELIVLQEQRPFIRQTIKCVFHQANNEMRPSSGEQGCVSFRRRTIFEMSWFLPCVCHI